MKKAAKIIGKTILWLLLGLTGLVALIVVLLYLPPVQDFVVPRVLEKINKPGEMEISVKKLRLRFPLALEADSLGVVTPGMGIHVGAAQLDVEVMPLLSGSVQVNDIDLRETRFRLGTPDSALYMNASVELAQLDAARVRLSSQKVDVGKLFVDSGRIEMALRPDTVLTPRDSVPVNWQIALKHGQLSRIDYSMTYEPTITDLDCYLAQGDVMDAAVDMQTNTITVGEVAIRKVDAKYIYPTPEYLAAHPVPPVPVDSASLNALPWSVNCHKISLTDSRALYAMNGASPSGPNLDLNYIQASEINIEIDSFRNRGTSVYVPIRRIYARERCGIPLTLSGLFDMDSISLRASAMELTTPSSAITLTAMMGLPPTSTEADGAQTQPADISNLPFSIDLNAEISNDDLRRLAPAEMAGIVDGLPRGIPLYLRAYASGSMADIDAEKISLSIPRHLSLEASGRVRNVMNLPLATGELALNGAMPDGSFLKPTLMDAKTAKSVNLPPMTLKGTVKLNRSDIAGNIAATAGNGNLALEAAWRNAVEGYELSLDTHNFPIQSILPTLGVSDLSASVDLKGEGLNPFSPKTDLAGHIDLSHVGYQGAMYKNITADVALSGGKAQLNAVSNNPGANFTLDAAGNLTGDTLRWNFDGDVRNINLRTLHLSDSVGEGAVKLSGQAAFTLPKQQVTRVKGRRVVTSTPLTLDADLNVASLRWRMSTGEINASDIDAKVKLDTALTLVDLDNGDLCLNLSAPEGYEQIIARMDRLTPLLDRSIARRQLPVDSIQEALPPFILNLTAGPDNIMSSYLTESDMSVDTISLQASNDSLLNLNAMVLGFRTGETRLDSIALDINQHGKVLLYNASVNNRPGTFDAFAHIDARGYIGADNFSLIFNQQNIKEETGFSFGSVITMPTEDSFSLRFVPYHPIIGYKDWEVNRDNFITYNVKTSQIDANIDLKNPQTSLKLFTSYNEADSTARALNVQIKDLKIQDFLAINPFAPPITGDLSANLAISRGDEAKSLDGDGTVSLKELYYGKEKVGDFDLALELETNAAGTIRANTSLLVNGVKTITAVGNLNDSTSTNPFNLDFKMIRFPLSVANPFLPKGTARLGGLLTGEMDITGDMAAPIFNGWLRFDSTAIVVDMLGSTLDFSDEKIPVENSVVSFNDFAIKAVNENPLTIDGTVDISSLSNVGVNLALKAANTQIVGSKRKKGQDVYGKAYVNLDASVKGSLARYLAVDAKLKILAGTNVTYVIPDVQAAIQARSNSEMVKFVNFADSTSLAQADSIIPSSLPMNINATLEIEDGSTIGVDLSSDGKNRAQIQANGRVNYTSDFLGDERVTGRINLNEGFVRYSMPPVLSEKLFNIDDGSYVIFNGPMMNPVLNLHATDVIKTNVNDNGNSRMVNFDVKLNVTGTLEAMNIGFDLATNDDITIENEITSMSADQRANQAMNLLLYGSYTGPGTKASTMGNPLYSLLESQLNNLASSTIKGVDISFGIDQLERNRDGVNSTAMSYSYQVSKSLFDDRFKIVVGGNYTTDADADENFAQNLIADISFEYLLNKQGTMYVKLFRHTGYESILEGEITQTGVGFVYKKKIKSWADFINWLRPRRKEEAAK